jgi:DNA-binding transcriptional LysR family regulator
MIVMREVDLHRVDLNLLVTTRELLERKSVTHAARGLGISQPAASRALARSRHLFGDSLLVDGPGGYALSERGEALLPLLRKVLGDIGCILQPSTFDPRTAQGNVRLFMPDLHAALLMPHLLEAFTQSAPGIDLEVRALGTDTIRDLEEGHGDAAVGLIDEDAPGLRRRRLYDEQLTTFMRRGHPAACNKLTLSLYLELEHVTASVIGIGATPIDEALARIGRSRRVRTTAPNFLAAMEIVARTNLITTLPESLLSIETAIGRFVTQKPPLKLDRFPISLVWHARHQESPRHIWVRQGVVAAAAQAALTLDRNG